MNEFKSQGTDKIKSEYNDKVKTVLDRFDSLTGEAGQYKSFSGIADGMKGKVKFIFQTAEIKNED
jgi:putative membrane protein